MSAGQLATLLALVGAIGLVEFGGVLIAARAVGNLGARPSRRSSFSALLTPSRRGFFRRMLRVAPVMVALSLALTVAGLSLRWAVGG